MSPRSSTHPGQPSSSSRSHTRQRSSLFPSRRSAANAERESLYELDDLPPFDGPADRNYRNKHDTAAAGVQDLNKHEEHEEEIARLKRYQDFTTIDWVHDAAQAHRRKRLRNEQKRAEQAASSYGTRPFASRLRDTVRESYEGAQVWIVLTLVGLAIGVNAAFLAVVTEWLVDVKQGRCSTAFYLSERFCCWGEEDVKECAGWKRWVGGFGPLEYIVYAIFAVIFAFGAAMLVKLYAPYAAGSGISEIKCIIAGFMMKGFLGFWTLVIKSLALPLTVASGLSVGKEGPSVHYAVCTGNVISRLFEKYRQNAAKTREMLIASAAAGVGVAFGSPMGGVLFSLEEMSNYFSLKTMWRSYFCALVATLTFKSINPLRTGQLVLFTVKYDRDWHFFEIIFYIVLGVLGGLYGAFVTHWNLRAQAFRKRYLSGYPVVETLFLTLVTAALCYPNMFLGQDMTRSMGELFRECEGNDLKGVCDTARRWPIVISLSIALVLRIFLIIISYGCKVPAGIFVPSMAVGALFGRIVGTLVQALQETYSDSAFFGSCPIDERCITPGTYAFLGAGAALSGIMHITVSVVVIMFELTGALPYILPTMIVVGVTKATSEWFGKGGIAERMIWFNGFPYPHSTDGPSLGVNVGEVMRSDIKAIPATGLSLAELKELLEHDSFQGYPVVESPQSALLVGYIGRAELNYGIQKEEAALPAGTSQSSVICKFGVDDETPETAGESSSGDAARTLILLDRFVDQVPFTVHPQVTLETVMDFFTKIGPRVILVVYRGELVGLVTVKDCMRYQIKAEYVFGSDGDIVIGDDQASGPRSRATEELSAVDHRREEQLWELMIRIVRWARRKRAEAMENYFPGRSR